MASSAIITIPQSQIGKLIGKGGSTIKRIKSETGANITIHDDEGQVEISGQISQIEEAEKIIHELIETKAIVKVAYSKIGYLIGHRGVRIKSIQIASNTTIKLIERGEGKRAVVEICGTRAQIQVAEKLINKTIRQITQIQEMAGNFNKLKLENSNEERHKEKSSNGRDKKMKKCIEEERDMPVFALSFSRNKGKD